MRDLLRRLGPEAALFVIAAVLLLARVGAGSLLPSDDCIYATAARQMAQSKDFLTPAWQGRPLFEKGPVLYWLLAVSRSLLGDNEAAMRLPGVLSALAVLALAWRLCLKAGLSRWASLAAVCLLLASNAFYFNARRPMTDLLALALGLAGFLLCVQARLAFLAGVFFGFSALAKVFGPVPFVLAIAMGQADPRLRLKPRFFCLASLGIFLTALPWHAAMLALHGRAFLDVYIGYHLFERAGRAVVGEAGEPTYLAWLIEREGLLAAILAIALVLTVIRAVQRDRAAILASVLWIGAGLPLFASATALPHYLVACLPAATLSGGILVQGFASLAGKALEKFVLAAYFILAMASFLVNNAQDLAHPDFGPGTKVVCERLRGQGEVSRLAGTLDLHDPCVAYYCDTPVLFFAIDPGFLRAVWDIPALREVVRPLNAPALRELAAQRSVLFLRPDRLDSLRNLARRAGVLIETKTKAPGRILVEVGLAPP